MIAFLPSSQNVNLLDDYCDSNNLPISKFEISNLLHFVEIGMSNLNHIDMLVADLEAFNDNDDDLITALRKFSVLYRETRVVVLALGYELPNELLSRIVEEKIHNIVSSTGSDLTKEISLALSAKGMTENESVKYLFDPLQDKDVNQNEKKPFRFPKISLPKFAKKEKTVPKPKQNSQQKPPENQKKEPIITVVESAPTIFLESKKYTKKKGIITIGICGTQGRIGTTHQSLMLCSYINSLGFKSAYLESNTHKVVENFSRYYNTTTNKAVGLTQLSGIDFFTEYQVAIVMALPYDVFVFDYGTLSELDIKEFLGNDIKIIVGGSKAWELPYFQAVFEKLKENPNLQFILSFTDEGEQQAIKDLMHSYSKGTFFSAYSPSPFKSEPNHEIYRQLLSDFIRLE